jgi:DNA polymerase elongation subunit (family B)
VIKNVANYVNDCLNKKFNDKKDRIVAGDTDSIYVSLEDLGEFTDKNKMADVVNEICQNELLPVINESFDNIAKKMNLYEQKYRMKREIIADSALFVAKKKYIANVIDDSGTRYNYPYKLKVTGVEIIRGSTPEVLKNVMKNSVKLFFLKGKNKCQNYMKLFKKKYFTLGFSHIAIPMGVNKIEKYSNGDLKGSPIYSRAAIVYNKMVNDLKLTNEPLIYEGSKIKYCYLKEPNHINSHVIGAIDELPEEFGLDSYINRQIMWENTFKVPMERVLGLAGVDVEEINRLDLFD